YYAEYLGGIVGQALYTDITDSIFSYDLNSTSSDFGVISGGSTDIGGIIGCASAGSTVINCLSVPRSLTGDKICQHIAGYIYTVQGSAAIVTGNYSNYVQTTVYNKYPDSFEFVTNEQLASGEVCYLLNGCPTDITGHIFTQDLPTALVPTNVKVSGNRVMPTSPCATSYYNPDDPEIGRRYKYHVADSATLTMLPTGSAYGKISAVCADCGESFIMFVDKIHELCVLPEGVIVDARHSANKYINAYRKFVTGNSAPFTISVDDGCQVFISGPDGEDFEMLTPVDHDDENGKTIYRITITDIPAKNYFGKSLLVFVTKHDGTCYAPFTINAANDVSAPSLPDIPDNKEYAFPAGVEKNVRIRAFDDMSLYLIQYKRTDVAGYSYVDVAEFAPDEIRGEVNIVTAFEQGFGTYTLRVVDYAGNESNKTIVIAEDELETIDPRFPDPRFCAYLYENYDADGSGYLDPQELGNITSVNVSNKSIFSLEGIRYLTGLTFLRCSNNYISELDLSENTCLESLYAENGFLTSLELGECFSLRMLDVSSNFLTSLDLGSAVSASSINVSDNNIASLDLSECYNLSYISANNNGMTELHLGMHPHLINGPNIDGNNLKLLDIRGSDIFSEGPDVYLGPQGDGTMTVLVTEAQRSDVNDFNRYVNVENWEDVEFVFDDTMYTVEVYLDIDDEYPVAGYELYSGMLVSAPAEPGREGFRFDGWFTDKACKNAFVSGSPLESDLYLYPLWTPEVTYSGYCGAEGDNIAWSFDPETGVLSLTGNGDMEDFNYAPWYDFREDITAVSFSGNITSISSWAFEGCTGLTDVTIPSGVTTIDGWTFYNCTGLTSISIPSSVTTIGEGTFYGCTKLENVVIPSGVKTIGDYMFEYCAGLTGVTIPSGVTTIGEYAFDGCAELASITIPSTVTSIGIAAFQDCSGLESITVEAGNTNYHSAGNCLIETESKTLIFGCNNSIIPDDGSITIIAGEAFSHCSELTSVTITSGVTTIGNNAFFDCSGLTSVTIPSSVTAIGDYTFYGCTGLTSVTIPSSVTTIGEGVFYDCLSLTDIYCEAEAQPEDWNGDWLMGCGAAVRWGYRA
ncbi:MAG: leucine-rich repeat protein, partial [Clostridiales bacterium]|nr:leucine-rich repeat protein [Candidatus Coliplasma equi]